MQQRGELTPVESFGDDEEMKERRNERSGKSGEKEEKRKKTTMCLKISLRSLTGAATARLQGGRKTSGS